MRLYISFSPHVYRDWLMTFEPNTIIGAIPSEYDNPLTHFISYETTLVQEVELEAVALYLAADEPWAVLAVHSELFVMGNASAVPPSHQDMQGGRHEVRLHLPAWTAALIRPYTQGAPWYAKRPQRETHATHSNQIPVIRPMTPAEASDDLERLIASADARLTINEYEMTSSLEHHLDDQNEGATLQFEVDLSENEYRAWLQQQLQLQQKHEINPVYPDATSLATSASAGPERLIQLRIGNEYAVQVYQEKGIPKADIGVLTVNYGRLNEWGELRANGYGYEFLTFILPDWTLSVVDAPHP